MENNVILLGIYGSDITHAQSAWVSTERSLTEEKEKRLPSFLKSLAEKGHHTPFEKSFLHFLVVSDVCSHIHTIKHRINVSVTSSSSRYREFLEDSYYTPIDWKEKEKQRFVTFQIKVYQEYHEAIKRLISQGYSRQRAKESARYYLTYANQLTQDISFNFRSFVHFQKLRNNIKAQLEIRNIAQKMLALLKEKEDFKYSIQAFGL